jgi:hypothetical protein
MFNELNKKRTDRKELRKFGITLFIALGIFGGLVLWRRGEAGLVFWGIGLVLLTVGLGRPEILAPIYKAWMTGALFMGFVMTHFILALMYYLVLSPVGFVMRGLGHDPLRLKFDRDAESYWAQKEQKEFTKERYEKMF